jgi:large subunit ribosomal protein L7/L12
MASMNRRTALLFVALAPAVVLADPAFDVSLTALGAQKISVIKEVRAATGLGLADTKKLVESPMPVLVKAGLSRAEADALVRKLTDAGATATAAPSGTAIKAAEPAPTKGGAATFAVKLESFGQAKIGCIKVVREATGLGLADTKKLVESAPVVVKQGLTQQEAHTLTAQILAAGGTASVVTP